MPTMDEDALANPVAIATLSEFREWRSKYEDYFTSTVRGIRYKCAVLQRDKLSSLEEFQKEKLALDSRDANQQEVQGHVARASAYRQGKLGCVRSKSRGREDREPCRGCGSKKHTRNKDDCLAWGKRCHFCRKSGHFKTACFRFNKSEDEPAGADAGQVKINSVCRKVTKSHLGKSTPTAKVRVKADTGKVFECDVVPDTGATDAIVSPKLLASHHIKFNRKDQARIEAANGTELRCYGSVEFNVTWLDHTARVLAYVSPDVDDMLLSWHTLIDLDIVPWCFPYSLAAAKRLGLKPVKVHTAKKMVTFSSLRPPPTRGAEGEEKVDNVAEFDIEAAKKKLMNLL